MTIDRYTCSCFSTDRLFESNSVKKRFLQLIGKRECPMKSVVRPLVSPRCYNALMGLFTVWLLVSWFIINPDDSENCLWSVFIHLIWSQLSTIVTY